MDKIICVGKNYVEHAKELGDAIPDKPVLFLKPPSVLHQVSQGGSIELSLPVGAGSVHHECEIILRLNRGGFRMSGADAENAIGWVSLGLDMTLRDRQSVLKKNGHPWEVSKVFPGSAVTGPWVSVSEFHSWSKENFQFSIDGVLRQQGNVSQMSLTPAECISFASEFFPLCEGDLIFTGTPAGVGPVLSGQKAFLEWGKISYSVRWT